MLRTETVEGWLLITHPDHAGLAGRLADVWGNADFPRPEPYAHIREAVFAHDDGWLARDASPMLTRQGKPGAFSRELVGTYSAFEEIDLADYLAVRGRALEAIAERDPYAAVVVSMHTVNLLTEQADLATIRAEDRPLHTQFIAGQRAQQRALTERLQSTPLAGYATPAIFDRAFRFLQCCDSFSLMACVAYDQPRPLRHAQEKTDGTRQEIICTPRGRGIYTLAPWPLNVGRIDFTILARHLHGKTFSDLGAFRAAYAATPPQAVEISVRPT
jgi:hypothetical protein